jgi:hypothetical protein
MQTEIFLTELNEILKPFQTDERIGPIHICVYLALLQCSAGHSEWFPITRATTMQLARLKGRSTYSKVMRALAEMRFINYQPSRYFKKKSRVQISLACK